MDYILRYGPAGAGPKMAYGGGFEGGYSLQMSMCIVSDGSSDVIM